MKIEEAIAGYNFSWGKGEGSGGDVKVKRKLFVNCVETDLEQGLRPIVRMV